METLTSDAYWQEICRLVDEGDYPNIDGSYMLLHEVHHRQILAHTNHLDTAIFCGDDLKQYRIVNGLSGLLAKLAYHAVLADCDEYVLSLLLTID